MTTLLTTNIQIFEGFGMPFELNWLAKIIQFIIESFGSIGLGIIMFTLALKLLTLPLDIYSRISTKKNSLKMKKMKPELEKLQRQYANNQALYSQKMQAIYKKNGYSMMSSCLPMLVTVVLFIVVITQFNNYSYYTSLSILNGMSESYTQAIVQYDDSIVVKEKDENGKVYNCYVNEINAFNDEYFNILKENGVTQTVSSENSNVGVYQIDTVDNLGKIVKSLSEKGFKTVKIGENEDLIFNAETNSYSCNLSKYAEGISEEQVKNDLLNKVVTYTLEGFVESTILNDAREASKEYYDSNKTNFLWVKNIWMPDLPWKHPIPEKFSDYDFYAKLNVTSAEAMEEQFQEITASLQDQKDAPNGYLILVILSIAVMLASQFISMRSQKEMNELSTVDGKANQSSKMMMWMMPIMFGVFAFIYNSSFSIYMIVSSLLSTISTMIINFFVEKKFNKEVEEELATRDKRFRK